MDADAPVEVAQKLNATRLLQACIEQAHAAATPARACLALVRLHGLLAPLRRLDDDFEAEWSGVVGGRLVDVVGSRRAWRRLTWRDAAQAEEVLVDLMDRHGMGLQAALPDPVEEELAAVEAELWRNVERAEDEDNPSDTEAEESRPPEPTESRVMEPTMPEGDDVDEDEGGDEHE